MLWQKLYLVLCLPYMCLWTKSKCFVGLCELPHSNTIFEQRQHISINSKVFTRDCIYVYTAHCDQNKYTKKETCYQGQEQNIFIMGQSHWTCIWLTEPNLKEILGVLCKIASYVTNFFCYDMLICSDICTSQFQRVQLHQFQGKCSTATCICFSCCQTAMFNVVY